MSDESTQGLSKQEIIWAEMIAMSERLGTMMKTLNESEKSVGDTVTSIEESMNQLSEQMESLAGTTNGVMGKKEQELQQRIDAALAEYRASTEKRDLEVIETITEGIELKIQSSVDVVNKTLTDSVDETVGRIRAEGEKAFNSFTDEGRLKWLSVAIGGVCLLAAMCSIGGWYVASLHYDSKFQARGFANAAEGEAAVKLSKLNDFTKMLKCDGFTEHQQNGHSYCVPMDANKVVSGWRIE